MAATVDSASIRGATDAARDVDVSSVLSAIGTSRRRSECVVQGDRRMTWGDLTERSHRLANHLIDAGLGCHTERIALAGHESGQDHLAIYLHNCPEYLEAMVGAFEARVAPVNVNYRYGPAELRYLLDDADARAVVVHSRFAPMLASVLPDLPRVRLVLQVADDSGHELLDGASWYDEALDLASPAKPAVEWSADDLYILYTGGTTAMPKGVLWRNADALVECFGGSSAARDVAGFVAEATSGTRALIVPPFMHGAGHWVAMRTWLGGGTVHLPRCVSGLDAAEVWSTVERERIDFLLVVGDAFARPLVDELARGRYDLSSLTVVLSGGAPLSARLKSELLTHVPTAMVVDGLGSSEAGGQLSHVSTVGRASTGRFRARADTSVLSADLTRTLEPGDGELGWLAKEGRLALGYLGDPTLSAAAYRSIGGVRYAISGDRAHLAADGSVELHGRDSVTITSGGEKIFAEEVEAAIKEHDAVVDCVVAGRPSPRWGDEVVAIVQLRSHTPAGERELLDELLAEAEHHIARYKLPKAVVLVDEVVRSPSGKADYRWARQMAGTPRRTAP